MYDAHRSKPQLAEHLDKIVECIAEIEAITSTTEQRESGIDSLELAATIRYLEVLIESMKHIPISLRNSCPNVPWSQLFRLQERVLRGNHEAPPDVVWDCARSVLPKIAPQIEALRNQILAPA